MIFGYSALNETPIKFPSWNNARAGQWREGSRNAVESCDFLTGSSPNWARKHLVTDRGGDSRALPCPAELAGTKGCKEEVIISSAVATGELLILQQIASHPCHSVALAAPSGSRSKAKQTDKNKQKKKSWSYNGHLVAGGGLWEKGWQAAGGISMTGARYIYS